MSKITYQRRKESGLCVRCGKMKETAEKVCCKSCSEHNRIYMKKSREFFKSLGLCPRCGKNRILGDEKECFECKANMYEINKSSRGKKGFDSKEYYKRDIAMLKDKGLCRSCRKRNVSEGHTYCEMCLLKKRERGREYRLRKSKDGINRSERPSYGLCYICGETLDRDGRLCRKCSEKMTNNFPEKIGGNEFWKKDNQLLRSAKL